MNGHLDFLFRTTRHEKHTTDSDVLFIGFQVELGRYALREGLYRDQTDGAILALLQRMLIEMQHKRSFYSAKLNHLVGELVIELLRFRHLFKEKYGLSPMQYVMSKRFELAKRLLQQTALSISAVSNDCGFSNDTQFFSFFKKATGFSPRRYRMQVAPSTYKEPSS
ncbi:helix-turn-helix transcriptional regulator [Paenibacillus qinlingensis]|uniref:AraC family transcriptional activator of pobA n=1 Tax=Paenibacillus qinlingensis TaxID=1837343 RepID=A0ABU1NPC7_9BACL|nr:helix-turn-helix transcriptional regulator [Paenibacillus qinlingensis]MDR6549229.1 AraC family transcriptional activator of pobA [Paenibacillus qinlingensis]